MRYSLSYEQWTNPDRSMSPDFHRISFALFRVDTDIGRVMAARCPERTILKSMDYIQQKLNFSEEAIAYMVRTESIPAPLFIMTEKGLGVLSKRYDLNAGVGLLCHIHCRPKAGARLINSGVLGRENGLNYSRSRRVQELGAKVTKRDTESYAALLEAWQTISEASCPFASDEGDTITLPRLQEGICKLAAFVGCHLSYTLRKVKEGDTVTAFHHARVSCYRPLLLEALLLVLLAEVRERSADHGGVCRIEIPEEDDFPIFSGHKPLRLTIRYPLLTPISAQEKTNLALIHGYAAYVGALSGLDLYFHLRPARGEDGFPEQVIGMEWISNPSLLPTSDLKSGAFLDYGAKECDGLDWIAGNFSSDIPI